jgi:hypothetical protein
MCAGGEPRPHAGARRYDLLYEKRDHIHRALRHLDRAQTGGAAATVRYIPSLYILYNPSLYVRCIPSLYILYNPSLYIRYNPSLYIRYNP